MILVARTAIRRHHDERIERRIWKRLMLDRTFWKYYWPYMKGPKITFLLSREEPVTIIVDDDLTFLAWCRLDARKQRDNRKKCSCVSCRNRRRRYDGEDGRQSLTLGERQNLDYFHTELDDISLQYDAFLE